MEEQKLQVSESTAPTSEISAKKPNLKTYLLALLILSIFGAFTYLVISNVLLNKEVSTLNNVDQTVDNNQVATKEEEQEEDQTDTQAGDEGSNEPLEEAVYTLEHSFIFNGYTITIDLPIDLLTDLDDSFDNKFYTILKPYPTDKDPSGTLELLAFTNFPHQLTYTPGEEFDFEGDKVESVIIGGVEYDTQTYCMGEGFFGAHFMECNFRIKLEDDLWVSIYNTDSGLSTMCLEPDDPNYEFFSESDSVVIKDDCSDFESEVITETKTTAEDIETAVSIVESISYQKN